MDVAKPETIDECIKTITATLKKEKMDLVAVVNNAGVLQEGVMEFHPIEEQKKIFDVNYWGVVLIIQKFLPLLRESKGRVIVIGSIVGKCQSMPG